MGKELRTCAVCHTKFNFCPVCNKEDRLKPSWHFTFCSDNCHEIYHATVSFEDGEMTAKDAKELLKNCDLSNKERFGLSYQNSIKKINSECATVKSDFPYMNTPVEEDSTAIADEKLKDEPQKKAVKIVKKSTATKFLNGDLENS